MSICFVSELERHNETLKQDIEKAERDKEDLKETHKNYMMQVQVLLKKSGSLAKSEKTFRIRNICIRLRDEKPISVIFYVKYLTFRTEIATCGIRSCA